MKCAKCGEDKNMWTEMRLVARKGVVRSPNNPKNDLVCFACCERLKL